jgi:hypothetical protein
MIIPKYKVVVDHCPPHDLEPRIFQITINNLLASGWKLVGGVSVAVTNGNDVVFSQALMKEEEKKATWEED